MEWKYCTWAKNIISCCSSNRASPTENRYNATHLTTICGLFKQLFAYNRIHFQIPQPYRRIMFPTDLDPTAMNIRMIFITTKTIFNFLWFFWMPTESCGGWYRSYTVLHTLQNRSLHFQEVYHSKISNHTSKRIESVGVCERANSRKFCPVMSLGKLIMNFDRVQMYWHCIVPCETNAENGSPWLKVTSGKDCDSKHLVAIKDLFIARTRDAMIVSMNFASHGSVDDSCLCVHENEDQMGRVTEWSVHPPSSSTLDG